MNFSKAECCILGKFFVQMDLFLVNFSKGISVEKGESSNGFLGER